MGYSKSVQQKIDYYQKEIDNAKSREGSVRLVQKVLSGFDNVPFDEPSVTTWNVRQTIRPRSVKQLVSILRRFRGEGLKIHKVEEDKKAQTREYRLIFLDPRRNKNPEYMQDLFGEVELLAVFDAEDAECKYEQVGVRKIEVEARPASVVEEPVFEFHCGQTLGETSGALIDLGEAEEALV